MGLETRKPRRYLSIYNGRIRHKDGDTEKYHDSLTGRLTDINLVEENFKNNTFNRWYFTFVDGGTEFILKSGEGTIFANSLINSLAGADLEAPIKVAPYTKTYDGTEIAVPYVEQAGDSVGWAIDSLPEDEADRTRFVRRMVKRLNEILAGIDTPQPNSGPEPEPQDPQPGRSEHSPGLAGSGAEQAAKAQTGPPPIDVDDDLPF